MVATDRCEYLRDQTGGGASGLPRVRSDAPRLAGRGRGLAPHRDARRGSVRERRSGTPGAARGQDGGAGASALDVEGAWAVDDAVRGHADRALAGVGRGRGDGSHRGRDTSRSSSSGGWCVLRTRVGCDLHRKGGRAGLAGARAGTRPGPGRAREHQGAPWGQARGCGPRRRDRSLRHRLALRRGCANAATTPGW